MALFFAFLILSSLSASVSLSVDLASLDFLWKEDLRIDAECSFDYDNIRITIPIRYGLSEDKYLNLLESGILVGVFPFENLGLMVEASLFKLGYFWGLASPTDRLVLLSEGSIGWNGNIGMLPSYLPLPTIHIRGRGGSHETNQSVRWSEALAGNGSKSRRNK